MNRIEKEAAVRHQPVAWGRDLRSARLRDSSSEHPRRSSETRLQAVVVPREKREDDELPCTD